MTDRMIDDSIEDAAADPELNTGGWVPPPRDVALGDDSELHPIGDPKVSVGGGRR